MISKSICVSLGGLASVMLVAQLAYADPTPMQLRQVLHRDFHTRGQANITRVDQDDVQYLCTVTHNKPSARRVKEMEAEQLATIRFPADGNYMGNWKRGEKLASTGKGMTWKDKPGGRHGGGCYNCHELAPAQPSYGTIGPSLAHFAKVRGNNLASQKYVYGKLYNAKAYNLCSEMPRFGTSGSLTEQDIKDLVAYLLDPSSPVNK